MARARATRRATPRTGPRTTAYAARVAEGWIAPGGRIVPELVRWSGRAALERLAIRVQLATGQEAEFYRVHAVRECQERDQAQGRLAGCALESEQLERTENRTLEREREKAKRDAERERAKARKVEEKRAKALAAQRAREARREARRAKKAPKGAPKKAPKGAPKKAPVNPWAGGAETGLREVQRVTTWPAPWVPKLKAAKVVTLGNRPGASGDWYIGGVTWVDERGKPIAVPGDVWVAGPAAIGVVDERGAMRVGENTEDRVREELASAYRAAAPRKGSSKPRGVVVVPYATGTEPSVSDAVRDRKGDMRPLMAPVLVMAPAKGGSTRYAMDAGVGALLGPRAAQVVAIPGEFLFLDLQGNVVALVAARATPKGV